MTSHQHQRARLIVPRPPKAVTAAHVQTLPLSLLDQETEERQVIVDRPEVADAERRPLALNLLHEFFEDVQSVLRGLLVRLGLGADSQRVAAESRLLEDQERRWGAPAASNPGPMGRTGGI